MAASLLDTRRQPLEFHRDGIDSIRNLGEHNMSRFFSSKKQNFTKVATSAASGGFILMFDLYVVHIKIFV